MFLPVILDFENHGKKFMLLKYLRLFNECKKNSWPIITHEEYERYEVNFPNRNEYKEPMQEMYKYKLWDSEERKSVKQYFIPKSFTEKLEEKYGSKLETMLFLLNNRCEELEYYLENYIEDISNTFQDKNEKIEGILYFAACPLSVRYVAEKYGIPMISYEVGPIRTPQYRCMTSYFCRDGLYTTKEIQERFENFKQEVRKGKDIPIFSNEEILALFLEQKYLKYISIIDKTPKYDIGVAGGCSLVVPYFAIDKYMDYELINDVLDLYPPQNILFRLHPGDMYVSKYRLKYYDMTQNPFPFLLESKRVAAVGSNMLFEAMLWKRIPCCKTSVMPATFICNRDYKATDINEDTLLFINFYIFGFLVPYELACNEEYMRWRLQGQDEAEIYNSNVKYYIEKFGLSEEWLAKDSASRLNMLKIYRDAKKMDEDELENELRLGWLEPHYLREDGGNSREAQSLNNSKGYAEIKEANSANAETVEEWKFKYEMSQVYLNNVLNSSSWKMTAPIRKILDILRRNKND